MNEEMMEDLERRGAEAARNLRSQANGRRRPDYDGDRTATLPVPAPPEVRRRGKAPWLAAAAALVVVAGAVGYSATRPDHGNDITRAAATEDPRPFVVDDLPGEMVMAVGRTSDRPDPGFVSPLHVYGMASDRPAAAVTAFPREVLDEVDLDTFAADGIKLQRPSGAVSFLPGTWVAVDHGERSVVAFGETEPDAIALAVSTSSTGDEVTVDEASLPEGWARLTTIREPMQLLSPITPIGSGPIGYYVGYQSRDAESALLLQSGGGDQTAVDAGRLFVDESRDTTIRGHAGVLGSTPLPDSMGGIPMITVTWLERPGEVIRIAGYGIDEADLLAAAESIRPVGADEWDQLVAQTPADQFSPDDADVVGTTSGVLGRGQSYVLTIHTDDALSGDETEPGHYTNLTVDTGRDDDRGSSSSSRGGSGPFLSFETLDLGDSHFISGVLADDVVRLELRDGDDRVLEAEVDLEPVAGIPAFAAEVTEDPTVVVAFAANGAELGRATVADLDQNVTVGLDDTQTTVPHD